jgi:hypothetical protein
MALSGNTPRLSGFTFAARAPAVRSDTTLLCAGCALTYSLVRCMASRPGSVTGDLHRDALAHAGAHHVPHAAAPEVVKELGRDQLWLPLLVEDGVSLRVDLWPRQARLEARRCPCLAEVADRGADPMKDMLGSSLASSSSFVTRRTTYRN